MIKLKDYIIIKRGSELHLHQLNNKPRFQGIELDRIIGLPYGSVFRKELKKNKSSTLIHCDPAEQNSDFKLLHVESGSDNRNIQDTNDAQLLTKENILCMKDEGISSQDIMLKLVENSTTFSHKTEFAQQKYLRKKARKYTDYIQILKPNVRFLAQILLKRSSSPQLLGLRIDSLSQIMTAINFQSEGTYIVYENNCQGLILAMMLNSLSEGGKILNIITSNYPFDKQKALKALQLPKSKLDCLLHVNISSFQRYSSIRNSDLMLVSEPTVTDSNIKRSIDLEEPRTKKTTYQERSDEEVRSLLQKKADGLVLVCKQIPNYILKELLQFLAPSRPFLVYCQYQEPLIKLYQELRSHKDVVFIRLFDNWLRSYQVLSDRTHPEITMSGTGGYLLTGITVVDS